MRIEECFGFGWTTFKRDAPAYVLVTFALVVANATVSALFSWIHFPFNFVANALVSGLFIGGFMAVAHKGLRGETPQLADAFAPCKARQGEYLLVGLATAAGVVLCGVGLLATSVLFVFAPLLVVQGAGYKEALIRSKDLAIARLSDVVVLWLVVVVLNLAGALLCGVGLLVSLPVTMLALAKAHAMLAGGEQSALPAG
jgi:uncharacterized membrane protein